MKHMLGYDDSLDCFGVHGIGGIIGALLTVCSPTGRCRRPKRLRMAALADWRS